jgi:hypothetical protein
MLYDIIYILGLLFSGSAQVFRAGLHGEGDLVSGRRLLPLLAGTEGRHRQAHRELHQEVGCCHR